MNRIQYPIYTTLKMATYTQKFSEVVNCNLSSIPLKILFKKGIEKIKKIMYYMYQR
jgi:hypothetical protein